MKRRRLFSILLALTLVVAMAVPAFAAVGSGTYGGGTYEYSANKSSTQVAGSLSYTRNNTTIKGVATSNCWCSIHSGYVSNTRSSSGSSYVYATADNYVSVNGNYHYCTVQNGTFVGYISSAKVVEVNL